MRRRWPQCDTEALGEKRAAAEAVVEHGGLEGGSGGKRMEDPESGDSVSVYDFFYFFKNRLSFYGNL